MPEYKCFDGVQIADFVR